MKKWATTCVMQNDSETVVISGVRIRSVLSAELFHEAAVKATGDQEINISNICHEKWIDLADTIAGLPEPAEGYFILRGRGIDDGYTDRSLTIAFLAVGRADTQEIAGENCRRNAQNLWEVLVTILDYAEFEVIEDQGELDALAQCLKGSNVLEIRRRIEKICVSDGFIRRSSVGFGQKNMPHDIPNGPAESKIEVEMLFPWIPSNDPWRRLSESIADEDGQAAFIIHFRGWQNAPEDVEKEALKTLAATERIMALNVDPQIETVLHLQADALRREALRRCSIIDGKLISARVFISASQPISAALQATVESCINDASIHKGQPGAESQFHGGALIKDSGSEEITMSLDSPVFYTFFGPRESSAILRTPLPSNFEIPGVRVNRSRTSPITGVSGDDSPLGVNIHRGHRRSVAMDEHMRFRHTYVIGQTGTGKSTFLLQSILFDIQQGRGVGVLDPHGSLIDDILTRLPEDRIDDVVLVDVTDTDHPVGFNILRIKEEDPLKYRHSRDIVIDDLQSYLQRTYDPQTMGPMFETHFRGMLGLLLGLEEQRPPLIPNLIILRSLYRNSQLRNALKEGIGDKDILLDELLAEITAASGEGALQNMAPYITAKFNRFVSDMSLRNITCQNEVLDIDNIVNEGKILLFHLGKGRFGDQAAGLLASQIVSRIRLAIMRRGTSDDSRPFYLYADEFQLFADARFNELLAEARKFKLSLTIAHQYTDQLPDQILQGVLGNVGTVVAFRIGAIDAERLESSFAPFFEKRDLLSLPNFRAYVRSFGLLGQTPFSIDTIPPSKPEDPGRAETATQRSRSKYGRKREDVEEEIAKTFSAYRDYDRGTQGLSDKFSYE